MAKLTLEQLNEVLTNYEDFLLKYRDKYPTEAIEYIKQMFLGRAFREDIEIDIMSQVYAATGVFKYVDNAYDRHIKAMQRDYDLNRNLIEVGAGFYPAVAEKIAGIQEAGSVTAYDPELIVEEMAQVILKKSKFDAKTDIKGADMLYAIMPCEATLDAIEGANENDIDLYLALCGCTHFKSWSILWGPATWGRWFDYVVSEVERTLPKGRKYEIDESDEFQYPTIKTYRKIY